MNGIFANYLWTMFWGGVFWIFWIMWFFPRKYKYRYIRVYVWFKDDKHVIWMWIWLILKNISLLDRIWILWLVRFAHSPPNLIFWLGRLIFSVSIIQITYTYIAIALGLLITRINKINIVLCNNPFGHSTWSWMYYHILWMFFNSRMPIFVVLSNIEFTWMPYYNRYIFIWWQIFLIVCFATIYDDWHDTNNTEFTVPMWRKLK